MLRINLLPLSVNRRRWTSRILAASVVAAIICAALPVLYGLKLSHDLTQVTQQADAAVAGKTKTDNLKQLAANTTAQIKPIQDKVDFVAAVHKYHMSLVRIYYTLAQYTDSKVIYSDAAYAGTTMTVHAYSPSLAEAGRYLQRMYQDIKADNGPNAVFKDVAIDHVPGYPEGYRYEYYVGSTLVSVGTPPAGVAAPGAVQPAGQNGSVPGQNGSAPPQTASAPAQNTNAPGAGGTPGGAPVRSPADAYSHPITPIETLLARETNPLSVQRQKDAFQQQLRHSVRAKRVPEGFNFTATLTLANPPVAPAVPGSAAGATRGGPGGPGGGPGGVNNG